MRLPEAIAASTELEVDTLPPRLVGHKQKKEEVVCVRAGKVIKRWLGGGGGGGGGGEDDGRANQTSAISKKTETAGKPVGKHVCLKYFGVMVFVFGMCQAELFVFQS